MKRLRLILSVIAVLLVGFFLGSHFGARPRQRSETTHKELTDKERKYLNEFANRTDNEGIGFVADDTFDYGFKQAILQSNDENVQRAFILHKLPEEIYQILDALKRGEVMVPPGLHEKLSEKDKNEFLARFKQHLVLMQELDGGKHKAFYLEYQSELNEILTRKDP